MPSNQKESDFVESPQPEPNGNIGGLILKGEMTTTLASHQPHLVKKKKIQEHTVLQLGFLSIYFSVS